jgi:hypothetical protein
VRRQRIPDIAPVFFVTNIGVFLTSACAASLTKVKLRLSRYSLSGLHGAGKKAVQTDEGKKVPRN